jgi:hypothetical protein
VASLSAQGRFGDSTNGWLAGWEKKILAATDSAGHRAFEVFADGSQAAISGALLPVMARDAVLCTDGFATSERIAKDERIPHFALNAGRRTKRTPRSHHINSPPRTTYKLLIMND